VFTSLRYFLQNEEGATAVEYGLIAALLCVGVASSTTVLGELVVLMYQYVADSVTATAPTP